VNYFQLTKQLLSTHHKPKFQAAALDCIHSRTPCHRVPELHMISEYRLGTNGSAWNKDSDKIRPQPVPD